MQSVLIKDTTRAQREEIVRRGLASCDGDAGSRRAEERYRPYIEGGRELHEIHADWQKKQIK